MLFRSDPIAYCLNDDGDMKFGINLASIYNRFIEWQNTVLNFILQKIRNGKLSYFTDQLSQSQSIKIQDASKLEIVNFNLKKSFNELIYYYSQRDFTLENGNLNYEGYKNIIYDLEALNEDIGKRILIGKKIFDNEQKFVVYGYEGFQGDKSSMIKDFCKKYEQRPLSFEEIQIIKEYEKKDRIDYENTLISLQILLFRLNKENRNSKTQILDIVKFMNVNFSEDLIRFFTDNNTLSISTLLELYEYIEDRKSVV